MQNEIHCVSARFFPLSLYGYVFFFSIVHKELYSQVGGWTWSPSRSFLFLISKLLLTINLQSLAHPPHLITATFQKEMSLFGGKNRSIAWWEVGLRNLFSLTGARKGQDRIAAPALIEAPIHFSNSLWDYCTSTAAGRDREEAAEPWHQTAELACHMHSTKMYNNGHAAPVSLGAPREFWYCPLGSATPHCTLL